MWGHWCRLEIWEDCSYSSQFLLGEGSSEFIFVLDVGLNVLLGTKFPCLSVTDELGIELSPKDMFQGAEVVGVDSIGHESGRIGFIV